MCIGMFFHDFILKFVGRIEARKEEELERLPRYFGVDEPDRENNKRGNIISRTCRYEFDGFEKYWCYLVDKIGPNRCQLYCTYRPTQKTRYPIRM